MGAYFSYLGGTMVLDGFLLIVPIILCIALGWVLAKRGILTPQGVADINRLVYYVAMPALLFRSMLTVESSHFSDWHFIVVIHLCYIITLFAIWWLGRREKMSQGALAASMLTSIRSNVVFMGLPAAVMAYGEAGFMAYCRFVALSLVGYEFFSVLGGLLVAAGGFSLDSLKRVFRRMISNTMLIACFAGLMYGLFAPAPLPRWLDYSIEIMANTGTGIALAALGAKMRPELLRGALKKYWPDLLVRLVISPLAALLGFLLLPTESLLMRVAVLIMAMPVAVNTLPLAEGMGIDTERTAAIIIVTTLFSVVSLPLWIPLLEMF